mmetsp:Transcript_11549/g.26846  ORF Transcript_11549/g.26846 Transcript_11549/m.26846 type:complete len:945 (-) Transcript_11549:14-2848(-)
MDAAGRGMAQTATAELLAAIDAGTLDAATAQTHEASGASLDQALGHALLGGRTQAVLVLAGDCGVRLFNAAVQSAPPASTPQPAAGAAAVAAAPAPPAPAPVSAPSPQEILALASQDRWAIIAYYVAAKSAGIEEAWTAIDTQARRHLQSLVGMFKVKVPKDVRVKYIRTGTISEDVFIEKKPWLLPRPQPDEVFVAVDGSVIRDGWYRVVMYPLDDDLAEAWLRPKFWDADRREQVANVLRTRGETLLGKAVKAGQWELVQWVLQNRPRSRMETLIQQLPLEFQGVLSTLERRAIVSDMFEFERLRDCLDHDGVLKTAWRPGSSGVVPQGARLPPATFQLLLDIAAEAPLQPLDRSNSTSGILSKANGGRGGQRGAFGKDRHPVRIPPPAPTFFSRRTNSPPKKSATSGPWMSRSGGLPRASSLSRVIVSDTGGDQPQHVLRDMWRRWTQRMPGSAVTFLVPQSAAAHAMWQDDLASAGTPAFAWTLVHHAARAGKSEVLTRLLELDANPNATDLHRNTAFEVAVGASQWQAAECLLEEGCHVDGRSKAMVEAASIKQSRNDSGAGQAKAKELLQKLAHRPARVRARSLEEFFRWQVAGRVVHGLQPRRFKVAGSGQELQAAEESGMQEQSSVSRRLLLKAMAFSMGGAGPIEDAVICFAEVTSEIFQQAKADQMLPLSSLKLVREESLQGQFAVAVALEASSAESRDGGVIVRPPGASALGPLAGTVPILARSVPSCSLRISCQSKCCGAPLGGVQVRIDGVQVGEVPARGELEIQVPPQPLQVVPELFGRKLAEEKIDGASSEEYLEVQIPLEVYIYVHLVDKETNEEFVFVCGHTDHLEADDRGYQGDVTWMGGQKSLSKLEPVVLPGDVGCLKILQSLRLLPKLGDGRSFEEAPWPEDTGACEFQRCFNTPVRVGRIFNSSSKMTMPGTPSSSDKEIPR